ncbi:MAG: PAS domain-containing protein, partial [Pseudomonadota bacterium]
MSAFAGNGRLIPSLYWLGAGGLIAFLFLAMGADRYWAYQRSIEAEKRHLGELARIAEENISGRLRAVRLIFDRAAEIVSAPSSGEDEISRRLQILKDVLPEIRQIFVTDERGFVTHMSLSGFKGFDASRRAYFVDSWNDPDPGTLHITGPVRAPTQEAPLILQSSRALMGRDGRRRGVVGASLEIGLFNEVMDSVRPIEMNGSAALIDKDGIVMAASSNVRHVIGRNIGPDSATRTHVYSGAPVSFHVLPSPIDGVEKLLVARTLTQENLSPLTFVIMSPMSKILERWEFQSVVSLAVLIATSAAILLLTALLRRREAESRRRERALAESESRLSLVIRGTNDGIWDWNIETGEDYLSPRWKEILGYRDDELPNVAASFFGLIHPDDKAAVESAVRRHIETGEPYRVEMRLRHRDGTYRWILSRGESVRDAKAKAVRMVGAITDVTEQKAWEEKIRELAFTLERRVEERTRDLAAEKERAESYLQIANTMIVSLGAAGEIRMVNRKGCEILGRPEAELLGRNWFETCIPESQREDVRDVFAKILAGRIEAVENYENEILTAGGGRRLILWHNSFLRGADGRIEGCLSAGEDITDRHRAEEALKISEERFQTSQTFANIGTWDWNIVTGNLYWSERIGPLFGYDKRTIETTYENFLAAIHS